MNKYQHLFVCLIIFLALLAGCGKSEKINSSVGTENLTSMDSGRYGETTDWEPSTHKIINNFNGITMTIIQGTVSPANMTIVFKNNSGNRCVYGESYWLEKKISGRWYQLPVVIDGNYAFNSIAHNLDSGDNGEWKVDWAWLYGILHTGEYRIVKDIMDIKGSGEQITYYLAAEFTIDYNGAKAPDTETGRTKFK